MSNYYSPIKYMNPSPLSIFWNALGIFKFSSFFFRERTVYRKFLPINLFQ